MVSALLDKCLVGKGTAVKNGISVVLEVTKVASKELNRDPLAVTPPPPSYPASPEMPPAWEARRANACTFLRASALAAANKIRRPTPRAGKRYKC